MSTNNFLKNTIQTLAIQNPQGCFQDLYKRASTILEKYWRFKTEGMMQGITFSGMQNLIGLSPAKLLQQEIILPGNCRPDFMTIPSFYKINSVTEKALLPRLYKKFLKEQYGGKVLVMSSKSGVQQLEKTLEEMNIADLIKDTKHLLELQSKYYQTKAKSDPNICITLSCLKNVSQRQRATSRFMDTVQSLVLVEPVTSIRHYYQCLSGARVIMIHLKRGNFGRDMLIQKKNSSKNTGKDIDWNQSRHSMNYSDSLLQLMKHKHLKYIDHYYIGTSVTDKAKEYIESKQSIYLDQQNKSGNKVEVKYHIMSYEEFLQDNVFDIVKLMDPNTSDGFYHNILNTIEYDKDLKYRYLKATNNKSLPVKLQF
jgi:hypothetical protein